MELYRAKQSEFPATVFESAELILISIGDEKKNISKLS